MGSEVEEQQCCTLMLEELFLDGLSTLSVREIGFIESLARGKTVTILEVVKLSEIWHKVFG